MKGKGWYKESLRHSLARKGIKTNINKKVRIGKMQLGREIVPL